MGGKNFTPVDNLIQKNQKNISGSIKEAEPVVLPPEEPKIKEVAEYEPEEEVKPFVQVKGQTIQLPPDLKKLGLQPTSPAGFQSFQNVKTPISDDKVITGLHAPITSSFRWLATLALYILRSAHLGLKVIHGKVIRVIRG